MEFILLKNQGGFLVKMEMLQLEKNQVISERITQEERLDEYLERLKTNDIVIAQFGVVNDTAEYFIYREGDDPKHKYVFIYQIFSIEDHNERIEEIRIKRKGINISEHPSLGKILQLSCAHNAKVKIYTPKFKTLFDSKIYHDNVQLMKEKGIWRDI